MYATKCASGLKGLREESGVGEAFCIDTMRPRYRIGSDGLEPGSYIQEREEHREEHKGLKWGYSGGEVP